MKPVAFNIPILDVRVCVFFEKEHSDASRAIKKYLKEDFDCSEAIACVGRVSNKIACWLGPKTEYKTIAHECYHIVEEAYEFAGCKMGADTEMDACFLEFISGHVFKAWDKTKPKIRNAIL
jgi:hypothetical protein